MRLGGEPVGRWGIALLAITAITGAGLAVHGWSSRSGGATPGLASGSRPAATAPAASSQPAASPPAASPSASPAASAGPLLSSEPYARAAFQIWPGTLGTAAKAAMTGLSVSVHKRGSGLSVTAGVNGQQAGAPHTYPGGAKVYVVETSMGDDSGSSDYNLGDDGLVVTDSKGRIVQ